MPWCPPTAPTVHHAPPSLAFSALALNSALSSLLSACTARRGTKGWARLSIYGVIAGPLRYTTLPLHIPLCYLYLALFCRFQPASFLSSLFSLASNLVHPSTPNLSSFSRDSFCTLILNSLQSQRPLLHIRIHIHVRIRTLRHISNWLDDTARHHHRPPPPRLLSFSSGHPDSLKGARSRTSETRNRQGLRRRIRSRRITALPIGRDPESQSRGARARQVSLPVYAESPCASLLVRQSSSASSEKTLLDFLNLVSLAPASNVSS